ncbi:MAG: hypothetical protein ABII96_12055 [Candidatus Zixiibacteriota bacterium]
MKTSDKLGKSLETINLLEKNIKEIIREVDDYDLKRLLKKIDAECMDLHHNITVAKRLAGEDKD